MASTPASHGSNRTIEQTAVRLTAADLPNDYELELKAAAGNGGIIYVGLGNTVTAGSDAGFDGFPLSANQSLSIPKALVALTSDVWLIGSDGTQVVYWMLHNQVTPERLAWALDFSSPGTSGYLPL